MKNIVVKVEHGTRELYTLGDTVVWVGLSIMISLAVFG